MSSLVVAILGPTASGKSAAALEIAEQLAVEIISVDSALIYRGMDIGTAKPTTGERAAVPHHLIDILDPRDSYSVMRFREDALRLIEEITARKKLPLLVGGTMLYFFALQRGLDNLPEADPVIRARLDQELAQVGSTAMHARLALLDPMMAERLKPTDTQRIQRALEVIELTGQPMSSLLKQKESQALPFNLLPIALEPSNRIELHARIATRFDAMLNGGLIEEVKTLRSRGDLHSRLPSMRCVGYRQVWEYLDGEMDLATLREKGIAATRQLAKRQLTWLRAMPQRASIDCLSKGVSKQVLAKIKAAK